MIKFLCPNGHPLSAPENLAGKPGKCPKCNLPFVVPRPDAVQPAAAPAPVAEAPAPTGVPAEATAPVASNSGALSGSAIATAASTPETPAMGSGTGLPAGEVFVFLCPNGHKLNGPPSMKGKAGKCPHCGARFRIPTDEELEAAEEEEVPTGEAEEEFEEEIPEGEPTEEGVDFNRLFGGETGEEAIAPPPPGAAGLGYIVGRLWERRNEETELEIFLTEGEIIAPDAYSEVLSSSEFGVFATREGDDSYAVTVIPWSSVRRVGMRKLGELPGPLFG
jgi:hypothetical protein